MKPHLLRRPLAAFCLIAFTCSASAANEYWKAAASGTWDTSNTINWAATSDGSPTIVWTNGNNAFFDQSDTYTVSTTSGLTADTITFSSGTNITFAGGEDVLAKSVTIASGATVGGNWGSFIGKSISKTTALMVDGRLTAAGATIDHFITLTGSGTINNTGSGSLRFKGSSIFSGDIGGTWGVLLETGSNSIDFSGNNTYSGTTLLRSTGGALRLSDETALSVNSPLRFGSGTNVIELASSDFSRALGTAPGAVRFNNAAEGTGSSGFAAIGEDRTVALTSDGGLVWSNFTAGTTILTFSPTHFILGNANSTHKVTLTSDLDLGAGTRTISSTDGTAAVEGEISGVLSNGSLTKAGTGTIILSGDNAFMGNVAFSSGSSGFLRLTNSNALGPDAAVKSVDTTGSSSSATGGIELAGGVIINNKNLLAAGRDPGPSLAVLRNVSGDNSWNGNITFANAGGPNLNIEVATGKLTLGGTLSATTVTGNRNFYFRGNGDAVINGVVQNGSANVGIDKGGIGTMALTNTNTATGNITITGGILSLGDGTIKHDGTTAAATITNNANLTFNRFGNATNNSAISGSGNVTKLGAGTQTLTGTNSWSGTTLISKGILEAKKTTQLALGTGDVTVTSGATLQITDHAGGGQLAYANNLVLSGTGDGGNGALFLFNSANFSMTGNISLAANTTIKNNTAGQTAPTTFSGVISGVGGLTLEGSSTGSGTPHYILSAANTYGTGTQETNFNYSGANVSRLELSTVSNVLPTGTTLTFGGTGATDLLLDGISQTVAGLAETGAAVHRIVGNSATNTTLTINNATANSFDGTIGGVGTNENNLGLTKTGGGVLTLAGSNTYSGATAINVGTLAVNGALPNSVVTVASAAVLGGNGTLGGGVTISSGAIHAPGNSPGVQTFSGSLTYDNASIFAWDLDTTKSGRGENNAYDGVNVAGTNLIDGGSAGGSVFRVVLADNQTFADTFWDTTRQWTDIFQDQAGTAPVAWTSLFTSFEYRNTGGEIAPGSRGGFSFTDVNTLTWSAVPEPSGALAGILLALGILRRRRA